ncbi:MAG: hypothetical protein JWO46_2294 [Nocardioidaceae bacterium]|nr:hypothetical protein [Nocardioidaceae bacterium]
MDSLPRRVRYLVAVGTGALLVGGCAHSAAPNGSAKPASSAPASSSAAAAPPEQHYVDTVNELCDKLLPDVIQVTHGGSIDIPASQYLTDWPAHRKLLVAFDKALAAVPVPAAAAPAAAAMRNYVTFADRLDAARLKAAKQGEGAWRREVAAEADVESDPSIAARTAAGFADSCDAR